MIVRPLSNIITTWLVNNIFHMGRLVIYRAPPECDNAAAFSIGNEGGTHISALVAGKVDRRNVGHLGRAKLSRVSLACSSQNK